MKFALVVMNIIIHLARLMDLISCYYLRQLLADTTNKINVSGVQIVDGYILLLTLLSLSVLKLMKS